MKFAPREIFDAVPEKTAPAASVTAPVIFANPPTHNAFVTPKPPAVINDPLEIALLSNVPGMETVELAPVPPIVKRVVAPASAVNVADAVVIEVVNAGVTSVGLVSNTI